MRRAQLSITVFVLAMVCATTTQAQVLTEWVETNPNNTANKLVLGYPVPMPVDTPLPFDGFRSYAGLHARHQDLAATTPWVHPEALGTTHAGRTIWAYRLGDGDFETVYGLPEPATLTNGGIHAREWQTPEVVTGIMELMTEQAGDNHFYDYLLDNLNMVVIPVLNVDGFNQTQRYPSTNYLQTDPNRPATSPRDGRMRRKNMLGVDEALNTTADHLLGVDLNRNNAPWWATSTDSSGDNRSLVHHGASPASEPETKALDLGAHLGPIEQLRLYTDVHSFSQVHFWNSNGNQRLTSLTNTVLNLFTSHHMAFPAAKHYFVVPPTSNAGIGTTAEYFTFTYQVPSWTLEVEPTNGNHPGLPGQGADYGGANQNGHDGFILPESQIRRVREQLAQTFAGVFYRQAGPANVQAVRVVDVATDAVVYEAEWDVVNDQTRVLYEKQIQPLELGRDYIQWTSYTKPMRWRQNGIIQPFQGISPGFLTLFNKTVVGDTTLNTQVASETWLNQPGGAPDGYMDYQDDAVAIAFQWPRDGVNEPAINGTTMGNLRHLLWDITGNLPDAKPATVAHWANGHWNNFEDTAGEDSDFGGEDSNLNIQITDQVLDDPFTLQPGIAAAWGDPARVGEGFVMELLDNGLAVMFWFTNDDDGGQDWYIAVGEVRGNRLLFPRVLRVSGGVFGDDFDPDAITEEVVGSATFLWESCDSGSMDWRIGNRRGRQNLLRLTRIMGLDCGPPLLSPISEEALYSGAWGDPTHDGEGFVVEVLAGGGAFVVWFSFGPDGHRRWYFGIGDIIDGKLVFDNLLTTEGGVFGADFDPDDVTEKHWGTLELDLKCDGGTATYASVEEGFGSGQQQLQKITNLIGLECAP